MRIKADIIYDSRISWKAKGLYCGIASIPMEHRSHKSIRKMSKDGRDAIKSGLDELVEYGYLDIKKTNKEGKFQYQWILEEEM